MRTPSDVLRILDDDRLMLVFERCMGEPGFETQARIGAVVKFSPAAKRSEPMRLDFMQIMELAGLVAR